MPTTRSRITVDLATIAFQTAFQPPFGIDLEPDALAERVILELDRIVAAEPRARRLFSPRLRVGVVEPVGPDHRRLELVAGNVPHLPGVVRHELLVQRLADRRGEVVGELAVADLGQLLLDQLHRAVAVPAQLAMNLFALRHLVDVLIVHRIAVLLPIGLDIGEEAPVDVEQLVVGQLDDRVVDRIVLAAGPEPDVRPELVGVAAVVAGPRQAADAAVLLDQR